MEKAPSPSSRGLFFLKRRYAAECAVLRAARAQNAALVEKKWRRAHAFVRGGEVELPSRPTDAGVAGSEFS